MSLSLQPVSQANPEMGGQKQSGSGQMGRKFSPTKTIHMSHVRSVYSPALENIRKPTEEEQHSRIGESSSSCDSPAREHAEDKKLMGFTLHKINEYDARKN